MPERKKKFPAHWYRWAAETYDTLADKQASTPFDRAEAVELLKERLADEQPAIEELCYGAAEKLIDDVDEDRTAPPKPDSLFDLDGVYALGEGLRVAKAHAYVEHGQKAVTNRMRNAKQATDAALRSQEEMERLWPRWKDAGVTKQEAVEWWTSENEDDE